MAGPLPIQAAFAAAAAQVSGVRKALDYEPSQEALPDMPCVTMLFVGAEQVDEETGYWQTLRWNWDVHLYVGFSDGRRAQSEILAILPGLLKITRDSPTLEGSCNVATIRDALSVPELALDDRWLRKTIRLVAETEETGLYADP